MGWVGSAPLSRVPRTIQDGVNEVGCVSSSKFLVYLSQRTQRWQEDARPIGEPRH